ncbi:MAG: dockerin type I repeat-containing protein, partial [Oscillospiraceae bacterium]|nr:dockerin type I repeat-containing protein [Oscillospiraceae bacterium]
TVTTELTPPKYIKVKPQYDVCAVGEILELYIDSDTAEKYEIKILMPGGRVDQYSLSGTMIGVVMPVTGICEIQVKGINAAGDASAESVYVSVKERVVVSVENIGDANADGTVNITDATVILQYYSCLASGVAMRFEGGFNRYYADANGDGELNLTDASLVLKYYSLKAAGYEPEWSELLSQ